MPLELDSSIAWVGGMGLDAGEKQVPNEVGKAKMVKKCQEGASPTGLSSRLWLEPHCSRDGRSPWAMATSSSRLALVSC